METFDWSISSGQYWNCALRSLSHWWRLNNSRKVFQTAFQHFIQQTGNAISSMFSWSNKSLESTQIQDTKPHFIIREETKGFVEPSLFNCLRMVPFLSYWTNVCQFSLTSSPRAVSNSWRGTAGGFSGVGHERSPRKKQSSDGKKEDNMEHWADKQWFPQRRNYLCLCHLA